MKKIEAKIIADSVNEQGDRIITYILTFPRFILAELNTHRMFSRNSASSRAIPFEKMVKLVKEDPFIPIAWQKDHKGMQGTEYLTDERDIDYAIYNWKEAAWQAIKLAKSLNSRVTKQLCNRLLEPFMWHTALVTATEWENFFEQRCPRYELEIKSNDTLVGQEYYRSKKDFCSESGISVGLIDWFLINKGQAEIHMQALAEAMWDAMNESSPRLLQPGEWHLPFGDIIDEQKILSEWDEYTYADNMAIRQTMELIKIRIAIARCARISYNNFSEKMDHKEDIKLYKKLFTSGHMSPFEHCARAMTVAEYGTFVKGKLSMNEFLMEVNKEHAGWCNNFKGFIPYRYMVENNYV